jgi:molybdopterin adenylyltransferase
MTTPEQAPRIGILTISDRATRGQYEDLSGPAIEAALRDYLSTECVYERRLVLDEVPDIVEAIRAFASAGCALVCTTGGTGPAPRDVTPEAMAEVCEKTLPGFGESMRQASLAAGVPTAILSRQGAGIVARSLVVNLPGKPASIRVCLDAVFPAIPYCIDLIGGPYLEGRPEVVKVFRPKA